MDASTGFLDRLRLLSVSSRAVIAGSLIFEAIRILPVGIILLVAARLLGMPLPSLPELVLVLTLAGLWAATWNAMFVVAALRTRNAQLPQALLPLFLPFFLGSTIMVPKPLLPRYVQQLVAWNPLDRFVTAVRPLFLYTPVDVGNLAIAALLAIVIITTLALVAERQHGRLNVE
jgi:ABC-2 type transport system permease protein